MRHRDLFIYWNYAVPLFNSLNSMMVAMSFRSTLLDERLYYHQVRSKEVAHRSGKMMLDKGDGKDTGTWEASNSYHSLD